MCDLEKGTTDFRQQYSGGMDDARYLTAELSPTTQHIKHRECLDQIYFISRSILEFSFVDYVSNSLLSQPCVSTPVAFLLKYLQRYRSVFLFFAENNHTLVVL